MIDISAKVSTLREATACAVLRVSRAETITAVKNKTVPKGDVLETARTAGLFAVKRTSDMIPDCHPLPIEYTAVAFQVSEFEIRTEVTVRTVYKTGVEVEAMHGATVVALTMYDMLKPIDKGIEIASVKLLAKSGGKSSRHKAAGQFRAAVIVCSDSVAEGKSSDRSGKKIVEKLCALGLSVTDYAVIPDERKIIAQKVKTLSGENADVIILTGGTGLSHRDNTPEALGKLIDREIPGIMETARRYGQERSSYAMLSRGIAGMRGNTLILALPGSVNGVMESIDVLFPSVLHVFEVMKGVQHE
jgi:cyclic pyranopterin monophosphate synthase